MSVGNVKVESRRIWRNFPSEAKCQVLTCSQREVLAAARESGVHDKSRSIHTLLDVRRSAVREKSAHACRSDKAIRNE